MAEINDIVSKQAIDGIKAADAALMAFDATMTKSLTELTKFTAELKKQGISYKDLATISKAMSEEKKRANETEKQATKLLREAERAEKARVAALEKTIAKEKEHTAALKLEVKTVSDAIRQNKALTIERNKLDATTDAGKKKLQEYNAALTKNTEFIRQNGTAMEKQRMNIGNYASAFDEIKDSVVNLIDALGITAGLAGALKLVQGVIASTGAAADEFEFTMSGLRETTQFVARAFANWDFSNFLTGIKEANKEGRRYAETLDLIGDLQRSNQLQQNDIERKILEQRIIAKNKSNDVQVREAAVKEIIRLEELKLTETQKITQKGIDNELKNSAFRSKAQESEVLDFVRNYDKHVNAIKQGQELIAKIEAQTTKTVPTRTGIYADVVDTEARKKAFAGLSEQQKEAVRLAKLEAQLTDEKRIALTAAIDADQKATNEMLSGKESLIRLENSLRNELLKSEDAAGNYLGTVTKAVEKEITEYQKLSNKVSELQSAMIELRLANQPVPDSMVRELISSQTALENVKKEVEAIALGMVAIQSKGANLIPTSGTTPTLGKRAQVAFDNSKVAGPRDNIFAPGEASQFAIEQAQVIADTTFQIIADSSNAELDLKLSNLEKEKEAKLKNIKLTEEQKAKIEADYQKKSAKLKQEQFKKQKAADIIQAIINTALSVTKLLGNPPAAIAAGIAGAAQIALITAQKIPQFDSGTMSTPDTFIAGERRPEWMIEPSGRVQLVTKPTIFKGMAGATVIGGEQTKKMIEQGITPDGVDLRPDINRMEANIVNAIRNKRELYISASGAKITERQGDYYKTYINRKVQWAGKKN